MIPVTLICPLLSYDGASIHEAKSCNEKDGNLPHIAPKNANTSQTGGIHAQDAKALAVAGDSPSAAHTSPTEFITFYNCLMQNAPKDYTPWLFPVLANDKAPDALAIYKRSGNKSTCCNTDWLHADRGERKKWICSNCGLARSSWKATYARLSKEEAIQRLKNGGNIGIGAMEDDPLTITDRDDPTVPEMGKETLTTKSRKRIGGHWFGWAGDKEIKCNIPTEDQGEHRSANEYVVASGSYVPVDKKDIDLMSDEEKPFAGLYSVAKAIPPAILTFDDLPQPYKDAYEKVGNVEMTATNKNIFKVSNGKASALFSLKMSDIVVNHSPRFPHPLHASDTGANFSLSDNGSIATCWRHLCSLNAVQFLAVKSGKFECSEVGKPHKGSGKRYTDAVEFWAWRQAKLDGLIAEDDPIPIRALKFIAIEHKLCNPSLIAKRIPSNIYKSCLKIVEGAY